MKLLEEITKITLISARAGELIAESNFTTRLQVNLLIIAPFGSGKTTLFSQIEKSGIGRILNDYTLPGLIGTIKPSGLLIKGFAVNSAGSTIMVDEFQKFDKNARDAILNLIENHFYRRTLGNIVLSPIEEVGDFYRIRAYSNFFEIWVKASYVIGAMYFKIRTVDDLALLSRCFPVSLLTDELQGFELYLGKTIFTMPKDVIKLREEIANKSVRIDDNIRQKLINYTKDLYLKHKIQQGFITRGLWDLSRIAGINALIENRDSINNDDIDYALKFFPLQVIGYARGMLTPSQVRILDAIYTGNMETTAVQLAKILRMPESTVSTSLQVLENLGLVRYYIVGNKKIYYPVVLVDIGENRSF